MSWRDSIAELREAVGAEHAIHAIPAIPPEQSIEDSSTRRHAIHAIYAIPETDGAPNRTNRANRTGSAPESGSSGTLTESHESHESHGVADDSEEIDLQLEAADLIRRSGVEGLTVADLDLDTVFNFTWYARLGTAARPGLKVWFRALAAAKRSEAGLGLASAPVGHEHLVGVARRGAWSRLLTIEQKVDSLALVEHLVELAQEPVCNGYRQLLQGAGR